MSTTDPSTSEKRTANSYIVVAAYNEEFIISNVIIELKKSYSNVVVVDDGSTDRTEQVATAAGATVLRHVTNRGQGAALQTGITYALRCNAPYIVTFDGDGQHRVDDIATLLQPLTEQTADVVLGSRFLGGACNIPAGRRLLLRAGILFTRMTSGIRLSDTHNGMRAMNRKAAEILNIRMDRMAHASEIVEQFHQAGLRIVERPVTVLYSDYSLAKGQSTKGALAILFDLLIGKLLK